MIDGTIRDQMARTVQYVKPTRFNDATALTRELYRQMQANFLPVPPLTLHSPVPEVMAGVWSILQETMQAGQVDRALKEAVAAATSKVNECPYCVDVHTSMLHATADHNAADAILRGDYDNISDPQIDAIVQWVLANKTATTNQVHAPFSPDDAPEIVGTAVAFHYINRMVNVFLGETFVPVPSMFKRLTGRVFGATAGKVLLRRSSQPGDTLKYVPAASLPDDLAWAAANPIVAAAFAGFAKVVEEAGKSVLPEPVRDLVYDHVQAWNGEPMGLSRRWVEEALAEMQEAHRAAARLALLTALASYQVDSSVIEDFRSYYPNDTQLISATAWASFTAARRAGTWLAASYSQ
ncbi:MAG: carboxymuconolactone decarboxylase family protein [Chloroflexi bacterium]|nr:carboxymuconolactone decarboxylase family protein [Chloroflexota bacterium]